MDAISSTEGQSYRSWNLNLLKQMGISRQNSNEFKTKTHESIPINKNNQENFSNSGSPLRRTAASTNQIFADGTATSTIDSIEDFFKHGNLQNTVGIFSNAGMKNAATSQGAVSFLSPELSDTDLAKGEGGLSVSTKQGTTVNVRRDNTNPNTPGGYQLTISRPDGLGLAFESNDNMRITDLEDGGLSIFYASTGETHIYDAEGNKKDVLKGEAGALTGTDGDDLLINLNGTEVDGGDGDDTIVNFADNATINGGNGDDTILLGRTVANNTIDAGEGNDHLLGLGAHNGSSIDMGEGNNRVQLGYFGTGSKFVAGDGNNDITFGILQSTYQAATPTTVQLGNGNNTVRGHELGAFISAGNGNNTFKADSIMGGIDAGNGKNTVKTRSTLGANINLGDGDNAVKADSIYDSELLFGNGNNNVTTNSLNESDTSTGSGNNTINIRTANDSNVDLGDGNNTVIADSFTGILIAGDGDNTIEVRSVGGVGGGGTTIELGDGKNTVAIDSLFEANLVVGDGKNTVDIRSLSGARTTLGDGDNTVSADSLGRGSNLNSGDGNNAVHIRSMHNSKANLGKGHNTVTVDSRFGSDLITGENTTLMKALKESVHNSRFRSNVPQMFFSV